MIRNILRNVLFLIMCLCVFALSFSSANFSSFYYACEDYDSYLEKLKKADEMWETALPENFIYYEQLAFLGEFDRFVYFYNEEAYWYELISSNDVAIKVYVADTSSPYYVEPHLKYELVIEPEGKDLRFHSEQKNCKIVFDGCEYQYQEGKLRRLYFKQDNLDVFVYSDDFLCMSDFVTLKTAQNSIRTFQKDILGVDVDSDLNSLVWLWIALPVGAVVIAGGAAFVLLRKKRKSSPTP